VRLHRHVRVPKSTDASAQVGIVGACGREGCSASRSRELLHVLVMMVNVCLHTYMCVRVYASTDAPKEGGRYMFLR